MYTGNGKSRGYSLESFDWSMSTLSKLMHTKQASTYTVEMFVEIWKTDIQPGLSNTSLSNSSTTPHTSLPNSTPLSAPRVKATPSRKRTAARMLTSTNTLRPLLLSGLCISSVKPNNQGLIQTVLHS